MNKEAIRTIIARLSNPDDIREILRMAKLEATRGAFRGELSRYDRAVATFEAAREALGNATVRGQLPRYTQAA